MLTCCNTNYLFLEFLKLIENYVISLSLMQEINRLGSFAAFTQEMHLRIGNGRFADSS